MNRRGFLTSLGALGTFTILPGAGRVWKAVTPQPAPIAMLAFPATALDLNELFAELYRLQTAREIHEALLRAPRCQG